MTIKVGEEVVESDLVKIVGKYFLSLNSAMEEVIGESIEPALTEGDIAAMAHDLFSRLQRLGITTWPVASELKALDLELIHKFIIISQTTE